MSRYVSTKQKAILAAIAEQNKRTEIVAWCDIDVQYGSEERDPYSPDISWNQEQALRRSLRTLAKRGLVKLGRYRFHLEPVSVGYKWFVPGEYDIVSGNDWRTMTGVCLTK